MLCKNEVKIQSETNSQPYIARMAKVAGCVRTKLKYNLKPIHNSFKKGYFKRNRQDLKLACGAGTRKPQLCKYIDF